MDEQVVHIAVGVYEQIPQAGESPKSGRQSRIQDRVLLQDGEGIGIVARHAPPARGDHVVREVDAGLSRDLDQVASSDRVSTPVALRGELRELPEARTVIGQGIQELPDSVGIDHGSGLAGQAPLRNLPQVAAGVCLKGGQVVEVLGAGPHLEGHAARLVRREDETARLHDPAP